MSKEKLATIVGQTHMWFPVREFACVIEAQTSHKTAVLINTLPGLYKLYSLHPHKVDLGTASAHTK